ncbi:MAG: DUF499 domain-containing protein [Candidatus Pacebacteria bacterium]|nr:DUF499 domain-containing protein [Candidatus Paceibacterota bacterium]MBP9867196.1 DUF499 domain-containing protein [Candidatus Paceibacterota bacterium]
MNNLLQNCRVRESALSDNTQDDVLEILNLLKDDIDAERFFTESYFTDGINTLLKTAFGRFEGKEDKGVVKLTQNMGGGKTHSMITLGLLAKHPEYRKKFLGDSHYKDKVRVIGFSGRQSDTNLGIWGELAKQLGKEEQFKEYFNPQFKAPGNEAWINLLKGEPTLILLDELPPYFVSAKSRTIGNSDLSKETAIALANLFNAIKEKELSNVLVVISDLSGSYREGSNMIQEVLKDLKSELSRVSLNLTPVDSQNDLVEILKTKLFEKLPAKNVIEDVAKNYQNILKEANQNGLTKSDPAVLYTQIVKSYPFHPSFINLYNRFKENEGFQQTRGVIRLVRMMLQDLQSSKFEGQLIAPQDINLTNPRIRTTIEQLNDTLVGAIKKDISDQGSSAAELADEKLNTKNVSNIAKLILVSSLSSASGGIKGLHLNEIVDYVITPETKVTDIKPAIEQLDLGSWYLARDKDGKLYFQNQQNIVARLNELVNSYDDESAKKEIKAYLSEEFKPQVKDLYQKMVVFPAVDELDISSKEITLIVTEPSALQAGLSKDLKEYWNDSSFKNRFLFLSGERQTWENLLKMFKEYKGIKSIIEQMQSDRIPDTDAQFTKAKDKKDKIRLSINSAIRETFIKLFFPRSNSDTGVEALAEAEITFQFSENSFSAEEQMRNVLKDERKFTADISTPAFRTMVEDKLFGENQKEIQWDNLKENAARYCRWTWHHPRALDDLRTKALAEGLWRDNGGYIQKGPFQKEPTNLDVKFLDYDKVSKGTSVKVSLKYGDQVYQDTNENVTDKSRLVENPDYLTLTGYKTYFLCVDSKGKHETGPVKCYTTPLVITNRIVENTIELEVNCDAHIKYTTDGSDPREDGGTYDGPTKIPEGAKYVRAVAEIGGDFGPVEDIVIPETNKPREIDSSKPVTYKEPTKTSDNNETFSLVEELERASAKVTLLAIDFNVNGSSDWITINFSETMTLDMVKLKKLLDQVREVVAVEGQTVEIAVNLRSMFFLDGASFKQFLASRKISLNDINQNYVDQN